MIVGTLVHIHDALGHVDVVLPLHCRLAVETFVQFRGEAVVVGNLLNGDVHQLAGVARPHNHLGQGYGRRRQPDVEAVDFVGLYVKVHGAVAEARNRDVGRQVVDLQREKAVVVGDDSYACLVHRDAGLGYALSGVVVGNRAAQHRPLCHRADGADGQQE